MMLILGTLFGTALIGAPLFVMMGLTTVALFYSFGGAHYEHVQGYQSLVLAMTDLTSKNVFLAIPFFVAAGSVMTEGGIARRLIKLAMSVVGWLPGGLAVSAVGSAMIFAAISASSPVTLIAVGGIMFPALVKAGYKENFALGLVTSAGSLGCLIPPSLPMIIYALAVSSTAAVDIGDLFLAGIGPGVFIGSLLALYCIFQGLRMPNTRSKFSFAEVRVAFREGIWALLLPFIILGGIYSGFFTATEAAAISLVYAIIACVLIYKELSIRKLVDLFIESSVLIGTIVLIIVFSFALNGFLVESDAAGWILAQMKAMDLGPAGFFLVMNLLLIGIGAVMDAISAILIFAPMLAPVAVMLGIDPIHLGLIFIVNMEIGYLMPPVATNLFVASAVFKKPFGQVARSVIPMMLIIMFGLVVMMYVPTISNGLVNALHGRPVYQPFPWDGPPALMADEPAEESGNGASSLRELMDAAKSPAGASVGTGAAGKPKSLKELMGEAKSGAVPVDAPEQPKRAKSLQEMMEEAKKDGAAQ